MNSFEAEPDPRASLRNYVTELEEQTRKIAQETGVTNMDVQRVKAVYLDAVKAKLEIESTPTSLAAVPEHLRKELEEIERAVDRLEHRVRTYTDAARAADRLPSALTLNPVVLLFLVAAAALVAVVTNMPPDLTLRAPAIAGLGAIVTYTMGQLLPPLVRKAALALTGFTEFASIWFRRWGMQRRLVTLGLEAVRAQSSAELRAASNQRTLERISSLFDLELQAAQQARAIAWETGTKSTSEDHTSIPFINVASERTFHERT